MLLVLHGCGATPPQPEKGISTPDFFVLPDSSGKQTPERRPVANSRAPATPLTTADLKQPLQNPGAAAGRVAPGSTPVPVVTNIAPVPRAASGPPPRGVGVPVPVLVPVPDLASAKQLSQAAPSSGYGFQAADVGGVKPEVTVYASPTTKAYFSKNGVDALRNILPWQVFLRKYQIPFRVINSVEQLERASPGVLLLPSSVALSEREKQAVSTFRSKGGSVLASWLTGVRDHNGVAVGYGFMEKTLDVAVIGNTEAEEKDNFLLPNGDNPVTHFLPAGQRIWLERIKGWYPLRLQGRQSAAHIMDWSRAPVFGKTTSTVVYDERIQGSGNSSRSVVLGYPEQLWETADPRQLEALAYDVVMWLLRQPAAYIAAWPHPHRGAFVMAVDVTSPLTDEDLTTAKLLEDAGGRGTYYILATDAAKSADKLRKLKSGGHEMGYLGDSYADFLGHPEAVQSKRLENMVKAMKAATLDLAADAGFRAPMDSYDQTTQDLLKKGNYGHLLATFDSSEARLPYFANERVATGSVGGSKPLVVLPRTQNGPEDSVDNCTPERGIKPFLNELDLAEKMGGLSVVSMSSKSELTGEQTAEIFKYLRDRRDRMWLTTSGQVADWWRERARVAARLEWGTDAPRLNLSITAGPALSRAPAVLVNLPEMGSVLRLVPRGRYEAAPRILNVDSWRASVVLDGLAPGIYQWDVYFDRPVRAAVQ